MISTDEETAQSLTKLALFPFCIGLVLFVGEETASFRAELAFTRIDSIKHISNN